MVWQDILITLCSLLFGYSLIPQIYYGFKHKKGNLTLQTSLLTTLGMLVLAFVYFTLNLMISSLISIVMAGLWGMLLFQKLKYK
jgi:hypothetical protein